MDPWRDIRLLCGEAWGWLREMRWKLAGAFLVVAVLTLCVIWPHDDAWLGRVVAVQQIAGWDAEVLTASARWLSRWGDFPTGIAVLIFVSYAIGWVTRRPVWRLVALAVLLSCSTAGLAVNCFRPTLGRARPSTDLPDRFYGPHADSQYHAFPSGHSATAFATAGAVSLLMPPLAVPAIVTASGIVWSRLYLRRHRPSDVFVGSFVGLVAGLAFGMAGRRLLQNSSRSGEGIADSSSRKASFE